MKTPLDQLIEKGRELEGKRTPEPWEFDRKYGDILDSDPEHRLFFDFRIKTIYRLSGHMGLDTKEDAEFVCHTANTHAKLLEIISVAREALRCECVYCKHGPIDNCKEGRAITKMQSLAEEALK